jgi:arabinogalactan endo-1,4-beta-galactosidase
MKLHKIFFPFIFAIALILFSCKGNDPIVVPPTPPAFAKGADVSWVTQMEANGKLFYNASGTPSECMTLLKSLGMNSIRLRVWVNPTDGWCNAQDMLTKAIRANNLGMRIMIDFHYSDSWADPGKQTKPAAWTNLSFTDLKTAVATHTNTVLNLLKTNNITPDWVQVGNESGNGMLWPEGNASTNMAQYAALNNAGYDAVKAVFPKAKVIVHVQNGNDNGLFRWLFDGLLANGGKWDVIGMSLYPSPTNWNVMDDACLTNMTDMISRYGKEVMICEVGMSWDSPTSSFNFLTDLINKTISIPNGKGLGVFYWEPECMASWNDYTLGAFDNSGKPTVALNAFN